MIREPIVISLDQGDLYTVIRSLDNYLNNNLMAPGIRESLSRTLEKLNVAYNERVRFNKWVEGRKFSSTQEKLKPHECRSYLMPAVDWELLAHFSQLRGVEKKSYLYGDFGLQNRCKVVPVKLPRYRKIDSTMLPSYVGQEIHIVRSPYLGVLHDQHGKLAEVSIDYENALGGISIRLEDGDTGSKFNIGYANLAQLSIWVKVKE